jgi:NAD(P)-dependent dehydrogenase (short-subunit alcohol dehydrogenase family)
MERDMEKNGSPPMAGKTVLVTGASSAASARRPPWAWRHWVVRMWPSPGGTASARRGRLARSTQPAAGRSTVFVADLSSQPDVRRLAADVLRSLPRIDVLAEAEGKTNAAIADALTLTPRGVEKHINAIFSKLPFGRAPDTDRRVTAVLLFLAGNC